MKPETYSQIVEGNLPGIVDAYTDKVLEELLERHPAALEDFLQYHGWTIHRPRDPDLRGGILGPQHAALQIQK